MRSILKQAAEETHETFKLASLAGEAWWPGTQGRLPESVGPKTGFAFQTDEALFIDNRGMIFFLAFAAPKKLGAPRSTWSVGTTRSAAGRSEELPSPRPAERPGETVLGHNAVRSRYRLLPSRHAVSWTRFPQSEDAEEPRRLRRYLHWSERAVRPRAQLDSHHAREDMVNHVRFYGPDKPLFDKSWTMSDIEEAH